jgi:choline dehydrogenase-like flavoprotein
MKLPTFGRRLFGLPGGAAAPAENPELLPLAAETSADAVVIGLGAGGSVALRELAKAGLSVIGLEQGPWHKSFTQREDEMFPRLFAEGGGRMTKDLSMRVLQGRGIGGSTVHNTNLCKRTPDAILDLWRTRYKVSGIEASALNPAFETIERDLSVSVIPDDLQNLNNQALRRGVTALGLRGGPLKHNRVGCQQSGFCEIGCAYDAKQNAAKIMVPQAQKHGARVVPNARVTKVLWSNGRVTGVLGNMMDEAGNVVSAFRVNAKVVVLAGSATSSSALALASGLVDPHARIGRGLRLHPGGVVSAIFPEPIMGHQGIPQSYECTEYLSYEEGSDKRVWIVPAFAHPIGAASMVPGFGAEHMRAMRDYRHLAVLSAMVHDETEGRVTLESDGRPRINYTLSEPDRKQLALGLKACARILLAAGATEVRVPATTPKTYRTMAAIEQDDFSYVRPHEVPMSSVHPMGGLAMGDDPKASAVNSQGEFHFTRGLFAADGSLFPTSIGAPPQISIYSFALHLSQHMVARAR